MTSMDTSPQSQVPPDAPSKTSEVQTSPTLAPLPKQAAVPVDNSAVIPTPQVPVDNSPVPAQDEVATPVDEPMQELPDAELPREIKAGAMGAERAQLMMLLGLDVNHPFDEYVEEQILERVPDYTGTVTKAVWRELYKETPIGATAK